MLDSKLCVPRKEAWQSVLELAFFLFAIGSIWGVVYVLVCLILGV